MAEAPRDAEPVQLEARLAAAEAAAGRNDFDAQSWLWMILLGVVLPIALILFGWFYEPIAH